MNYGGLSSISEKNVAYKQYLDVDENNIEEKMKDFISKIQEMENELVGDIFFSIDQLDQLKKMNITIYVPVLSSFRPNNELKFRTHLIIDEMMESRIVSENYIQEMTEVITEFKQYTENKNAKLISPIFCIYKFTKLNKWIEVKVKIKE